MTFLHDVNNRYFEDYIEGDIHSFGDAEVELDEIVSFARRFDLPTPTPVIWSG